MKNNHLLKLISKRLISEDMTLATAESCTAGLLGKILTDFPGSSAYYTGGVIVYSNFLKTKLLGINSKTLKQHGAVSKNVAILMAKKIRIIAQTDFGIGITGIAGPQGGTLDKKVGTVFIAVAGKNKCIYKRFNFSGSRNHIRIQAAQQSLLLLKKFILL